MSVARYCLGSEYGITASTTKARRHQDLSASSVKGSPVSHMVHFVRMIFAFGLFLSVTCPLMGQFRFGDIEARPLPLPEAYTTHGYLEYRISVLNHSSLRPHEVTLIMPEQSRSYGDLREISRKVIVGPSATVVVSLWQPSMQMIGENITVVIDGEEQRDSLPLALGRAAYRISASKYIPSSNENPRI